VSWTEWEIRNDLDLMRDMEDSIALCIHNVENVIEK
jgi:hypothetical protein